MKKVISFQMTTNSLNMVINCIYANKLFPDWIVRIHYDNNVHNTMLNWLSKFKNVELMQMSDNTFWKLMPAFDNDVNIMFSWDVNTWLKPTDKTMIDEWLNNDKDFYMTNNSYGTRNQILKKMNIEQKMIQYLSKNNDISDDIKFLKEIVYDDIISAAFVHNINNSPLITSCDIDGMTLTSKITYKFYNYLINLKNQMGIHDKIIGLPEKKVISYSLYGANKKYTINSIINCLLAPHIYPDWICRFYVDETVPSNIVKLLETFKYVEIIKMPIHEGSEAMLWRFLPASDPDVLVMISRDADSWISTREVVCVTQWLNSDYNFHIIRDHCYHSQKIMGGMWGCIHGTIPRMTEMVNEYSKAQTYDQGFLAEQIYPLIKNDCITHYGDPQYNNKNERTYGYFDDNCQPIPNYVEIDKYLSNLSFVEAHKINQFYCCHCKQQHRTFIGAILENIPDKAKILVKRYANRHKISINVYK